MSTLCAKPTHRKVRDEWGTRPFLALTLAFGNDGELHAEGVQDGIDGFEAWVCACTQGFVQALPA
jgi:hypothetical protein